jgi:hypothetical protein
MGGLLWPRWCGEQGEEERVEAREGEELCLGLCAPRRLSSTSCMVRDLPLDATRPLAPWGAARGLGLVPPQAQLPPTPPRRTRQFLVLGPGSGGRR